MIAWFFLTSLAFAEEVHLTVEQAMAWAVERNPTRESAELQQTIASISATRARLDRFTATVTANAGTNAGVVKPWGEPAYGTTDASWAARANVGVPLYTGGAVDASIDRAEASASSARVEVELTDRDLVRSAYTAFWNIHGIELQMSASEEGLAATREALAIIKARADSGLAAGFDVNRSTVDLLSQESSLISQSAALAQARIELTRLLHLPGDTTLVLEGPLPDPSTAPLALPADLLGRRPELVRQSLSLAQADASIRLARSAALPRVSLVGSAGFGASAFGGGPDVQVLTPTGGVATVAAESIVLGDLGRPALDASVGLQLTWNPFDLWRTRQSVQQAKLGLQQLEANNSFERDLLEAQVRSAAAQVDALRRRYPLVHEQLALARDNQVIVQDMYAQGSATILDLFNAQASFRGAAIQEAGLVVDLATAELDLRWLLGEAIVPGATP